MALDARNLRILLSIAQHGTFGRAAEAQNISQPALSNKIAVLEHQLGVRVIERGRNGAQLNEYGKALAHHARVIEASLAQAAREIELKKAGMEGPLSIGGTPVSLIKLVPRAMARLQTTGSRIATSVIEADDEELLALLRSGEIELMVSGGAPWLQFPDVERQMLADFPVSAVVGSHNPLAGKPPVALAALMDHQWVLPRDSGAFRLQVEALFYDAGLPLPQNIWACNSLMAIKSLVMQSDAIAILPHHAFAIEEDHGDISRLAILGMTMKRSVGVMWLRSRRLTPLAQHFVDALREVAGALGQNT